MSAEDLTRPRDVSNASRSAGLDRLAADIAEPPSLRTLALGLADVAGTLSTLHDQLETLLLNFADHVNDRDAEQAEIRDEILALSNRIESVYRGLSGLNERTARLA